MKTTKHILATITTTILLGWTAQTQAQWNAYNDFYLSPTASGWTGNTSALGTAWGYYMGNVNGGGSFPTTTGTYLNSGQIYKLSDANPAGASNPTKYGTSVWYNTGGYGFGAYSDTLGWGVSLGRYDNPWFDGAPGLSRSQSNFIWMQANSIGNPQGEGIGSILTWTAPSSGVFQFAGQFIAGNQYRDIGTPGAPNIVPNGASVAVIDSLNNALLSRTTLSPDQLQTFTFTAAYTAGDIVQFQVGSNFTVGNAVGLQVTATAIPEPSSGMLLAAGLGALGLINLRRRR